jgi:hypothetical protein
MADPPKGRAAQTRVSSTRTSPGKKKNTITVSLRVPAEMLKAIDKAVKARPYKIPRHSWLLEAMHEKLARLRNIDTTRTG